MVCEMCQAVVLQTVSYRSLMKFHYTAVCEFCRDRMKLEDWNHSCRQMASLYPAPEIHRPRSI